jgi:four helix bundle protein
MGKGGKAERGGGARCGEGVSVFRWAVVRCFGASVFDMNKVDSFVELGVYKSAFGLQQAIFEASKKWPRNEDYSLTDQVRRSSRSVGANLAEAWAKRRYPAHFLSKLTDSDGELQETLHWLFTAQQCGYVTNLQFDELHAQLTSTGRQLGSMINQHQAFCF